MYAIDYLTAHARNAVQSTHKCVQSQKEIAKALRILTKQENFPILVHCMHGKDRTGIVIMLVMLLCDNGPQVMLLLFLAVAGLSSV